MLASKTAAAPAPAVEVRDLGSWRPILAATGVSVLAVAGLYWRNPRLLGSWHGFLHTAIATRFSQSVFPPEDPFFAGERLPYYWFYHFAAYWLSRAVHIDLLHTFHAISWISLAAFVLLAGWIGRTCFRSNIAGLAIAWLGLVGVNPLGPAIAGAKHWSHGTVLFRESPHVVETTFVSNQAADDLMTQPLLGALYIGGDWRQGQNLVWFFDIGSRAIALAGLMCLLALVLRPKFGGRGLLGITALSAFTTAMNPLIGLASAGALTGAALLLKKTGAPLRIAAVCTLGSVLAAPTYLHLFFRGGGSGISIHPQWALPVAIVLANFLVLVPLAAAGAHFHSYREGIGLTTLAVAGVLLLFLVVIIHLPEGNEHNLCNAATCLLAVPAAGMIRSRSHAALLFVIFLPVTAATLSTFANRPAMPLAFSGQTLIRIPEDSDVERFYDWIRRNTPQQSVFVIDPTAPLKMSGNVSELPAFTSRTLFTDMPSYLTTPNRDAVLRERIARAATHGEPLSAVDNRYLAMLHRPVYVVTYAANDAGTLERLAKQYGAPIFRQGMVAAFGLDQ